MFTSFARRLTGWYVAAATTLVVVLLSVFAIAGLVGYVHFIQESIDGEARQAEAFSQRAGERNESFLTAAIEIERRLARPGIRLVAAGPERHAADGKKHPVPHAARMPLQYRAPPPQAQPGRAAPPAALRGNGPMPVVVVNGVRIPGVARNYRVPGSQLGFALNTAFGAHWQRVDLLDGDLRLLPDPDATLRVALSLFGGVFVVGAIAGLLAWFIGRYITLQVIRPLIDVTQSLQRFATRDFTPQPVAVAGKSEFDVIAVAYNAAAAQVSAAFDERRVAEQQMRQFVADAGHELRTPLTIVLGYMDLLRRKAEDDERSRRIFTAISIEGARMRTLIDNLVLLARMEGSDVRPAEPFELCPMLESMVDARRLLHPKLRIDVDCAVDATVIGDETEIHEAVANLLDNAIKYAPGSPIRLGAQRSDGGVEVTVADHGPGIHPDDREAIFDRFYRGATRGEVEGSGLGLAIAKRAVERAGGTLMLAQSSPAGTTFVLRLRADRVRSREEPAGRL